MIIDSKSKSAQLNASGYAAEGPTALAGYTITPSTTDLTVEFRNGGPNGALIWAAEADAGAGSSSHTFDPALPFTTSLYVTFSQIAANQRVCVHILGS
jgi:hypothetical protein